MSADYEPSVDQCVRCEHMRGDHGSEGCDECRCEKPYGRNTIVQAIRMDPEPWAHVWAWLTRSWVMSTKYRTTDAFMDRTGYVRGLEASLADLNQRIEDYAASHYPKPISHGGSYGDFSCAKCAQMWPCAPYQWATGKEYEPLKLVRKEEETEP